MNIELLCNEYRENKRMIEELTSLNEELKNKIVAAMQGKDTLIVGCTKVSNITVNSTRLDSTALKTAYPDIYTAYSKTTAYKRFTVVQGVYILFIVLCIIIFFFVLIADLLKMNK